MEFTLDSGKVVNYEKPNWTDRAELWDKIAESYQKGFLSLVHATEVLIKCKACTIQDLDNDKYDPKEVYEIANAILTEIFRTELDKKK